MNRIVIASLFALMVSGCGEDLVTVQKSVDENAHWIHVTSKVQSLVVNDFIINRGSPCGLHDHKPVALTFGQEYTIVALCNPIEVTLKTDKGDVTFTWNE